MSVPTRALSALLAGFVFSTCPFAAPESPSPAKPEQVTAPAAAPKESATTGALRGRVAGPDGKPLAGATVRVLPVVRPKSGNGPIPPRSDVKPVVATTGQDGTFEVKGLKGSVLSVRVEASGFAAFTAFDIPPGASLKVNLKPGYPLSGRVLDLATKEPLAGATVRAWEQGAAQFGEEAIRKATTGDDGRFRIPDMVKGEATLEALAPRHAKARLDGVAITAPPPSGTPASIEPILFLGPGGRLAGRVVSATGKPVAEASLRANPMDGNLFRRIQQGERAGLLPVNTDADGRFALEGLPAGNRYQVQARKKGFPQTESEPIPVEAGTDRGDLELHLVEGATLKARIVDADGHPVSGVEFEVDPAGQRQGVRARSRFGGGSVPSDQIEMDEDGRYTVRTLKPGTCTVRLLPPEYEEIEREDVRLRGGETLDFGTLTVREGLGFSGRVTGGSGEPIAGAEINAFWGERGSFKSRNAKTKADGRYRVAGITDSSMSRVRVQAKGYAGATRDGLTPGDTAVDFTLEKSGSVVGRVLLAGGSAPAAFRVTPHSEASQEQQGFQRMFMLQEGGDQVFTDPAGNFRLDDLDPGTYTLEATAAGKVPGKKTGLKVENDGVQEAGTIILEDGRALIGRVLDAKDDSPVAGAVVRTSAPQGFGFRMALMDRGEGTITSTDGSFKVQGLAAGARNVAVEHTEYSPAETRVDIPPDQDPPELVVRLSRGGTLTGTVRDKEKQPVVGSQIILTRGMMAGEPRSASTGPDGKYLFEKLSPGNFQVMRAPEEGNAIRIGLGMKSVTIRDGETTVLDFDETSKISLRGRVLRGGKPVGGTMLIFLAGEGMIPGEVKTAESDAEGLYQIGLDHGGTYRVMVQSSGMRGFGGMGAEISVPDQTEVVQDIVLAAGGISGTVSDAEGKPVNGAIVQAAKDGSNPSDVRGRLAEQTDPRGAYTLEGAGPGTYRVTATARGSRPAEAYPVVVSEESPSQTVDLKLEKGSVLRGRVVDPQGRGLAEALVLVAPTGASESRSMRGSTDVNGAFTVTSPSEGPVDVTAIAAGWAPARATGVAPQSDDSAPEIVVTATVGGKIRVVARGREGKQVSGIQVMVQAVPGFLGSDLPFLNSPQPTGPDGTTTIDSLAPSMYQISVRGGKDVAPVQVPVQEGAEVTAALTIP